MHKTINKVLSQRLDSKSEIVNLWKLKYYPKTNNKANISSYYLSLANKKSNFDFEIEKDLERTFPLDITFNKGTHKYHKLLRILRAIAYHAPHVGYVQGFNFIIGNLLKLLKNEE